MNIFASGEVANELSKRKTEEFGITHAEYDVAGLHR